MKRVGFRVCVAIGALTLSTSAYAQVTHDSFGDAFWQYTVQSGFDFSSGYYGAPKQTDILYIPVSFQADKGPWTLKMDVSWLQVSGPALLLADAAVADSAAGNRASNSASGFGDINLYGTYTFENFSNQGLYIDVMARLKIPTASYSKGLGTGQVDGATQVDIYKAWGKFTPFVTLGYRLNGSPRDYELNNVAYGQVGLQYSWTSRLTTGVFYNIRQAALAGEQTLEDANVYVSYHFSPRWTLQVYAVAGLSDSSPTVAGGATIRLRWP